MEVSIVIPAFNEELILKQEVLKLVSVLEKDSIFKNYEIIIVENGSTDKTRQIAKQLAQINSQIKTIFLEKPEYGRALKIGFENASKELVAFFNVDFWDIDFLKKAIEEIKINKKDLVVGTKLSIWKNDQRPLFRKIISRIFVWVLKVIFVYQGTDTHGVKLFRKSALEEHIFACKTFRELFDTELLIRAQYSGLYIEEIAVSCVEKRKSVYGILHRVPRTIWDLIYLFIILYGKVQFVPEED